MGVIAIDGPAGAGKSTVARLVAAATGLEYLDTGAMYRCVALAMLEARVDPHDTEALAALAGRLDVVLDGTTVLLDGRDVTEEIRSPEVNAVVSIVATNSGVRSVMRESQRSWARDSGGGVVEGRDIGTVVFPDADLKVFLTATEAERAARRAAEAGEEASETARTISERDRLDSSRSDSPLRPAEGAIVVDSTGMTLPEVVDEIVAAFARRRGAAR